LNRTVNDWQKYVSFQMSTKAATGFKNPLLTPSERGQPSIARAMAQTDRGDT